MFYSGHKKGHGLNFMGMGMANSLLPFMSFAALGKYHDSRALLESGFYNEIDNLYVRCTWSRPLSQPAKYVAFADPAAFKISNHVYRRGSRGSESWPLCRRCLTRTATARAASLWSGASAMLCADPFRLDFVTHFAWTSCPKAHQVMLSPVNHR
jgi:hypothetical protein